MKSLWHWFMDVTENFRANLSWKIFPEQQDYIKILQMTGGLEENNRVVKLIEDSNIKNKDEVIDIIRMKMVPLDDLKKLLNLDLE